MGTINPFKRLEADPDAELEGMTPEEWRALADGMARLLPMGMFHLSADDVALIDAFPCDNGHGCNDTLRSRWPRRRRE